VFLVTAADDGSRAIYFIARGTRHSTLPGDLQLEQQLNPLWPIRLASRDEVLEFAEAAPVGSARAGLLGVTVVAEPSPSAEPLAEAQEVIEVLPTPVADSTEYVLQAGDNLTRVSARYGTTVQDILDANGISTPNRIDVGQRLVIPGQASAPVNADSPSQPAPAAAVEPEPVADVPTDTAAVTYTVKGGDSAVKIARQFGVDLEALLAANTVANRNHIEAGQIFTIPG
jgi:LysM repeat protein